VKDGIVELWGTVFDYRERQAIMLGSFTVARSGRGSRTSQPKFADMDINAGVILDGVPVEQVGREIFEKIIAVAGGEKTKSEAQGVGDDEFAPWSIGPTL
jgi:altronate dehydratase